jgi:hypothetical protein
MLTDREIATSPAWLPLRFAGESDDVTLVRLDENAYSAASFLDERILTGNSEQALCPAPILASAAAVLPCRPHYIFHPGHVGSTLISRLIGAHDRIFSLREPLILRAATAGTMTGAPARSSALTQALLLAMLSRTWRPAQRPVIKMTSFLSEHAAAMLSAPDAQAIFVFAQPLNYLRGILAGQNSRVESARLAPQRLRRLQRHLAPHECRMDPRTEGEVVAMSWLCEMTTLHRAASQHRSKILWMDFDAFLLEPDRALFAILAKLGAAPDMAGVERMVHGPIMQRYSKGPEFAYDAGLRREVLAAADREHAEEIRRGLNWIDRAVRDHPMLQPLFAQH